jgi:CubicO group peptidase (beta-lactamase class C family)
MARFWKLLALVLAAGLPVATQSQPAATPPADKYALADRIFADYVLDAHIPGLVYGIVVDGQLVHVGTYGVQDLDSKRPVTRNSLFRIASMTKAFTALTVLKLRDDGRVRLDAPAADYVPELRAWKYPTEDTAPLRVRDLLHHVSGFVTDDPWGDRQQPLAEADFTQMGDVATSLMAIAPFADGPTVVRGVAQTHYEESDRPVAAATELRRMGLRVEDEWDSVTIYPGTPQPTEVQTYDDHRIAMSFAVTGLRAPGIRIANPECVSKTFPEYFEVLRGLTA